MRPDVKFGVVTSLVVVVVAGGYFLYRDKQEKPIPLAEAQLASKAKKAERAPTDARSRVKKAVPRGSAKGEPTKARRTARNSKKSSRNTVASRSRNGEKPRNTGGQAASGRNPSAKTPSRSNAVTRKSGSPRSGSDSPLRSSGTKTAGTALERSSTGLKTSRKGQRGPAPRTSAGNKEKVADTGATGKRTDRATHRTAQKRGGAPITSLSAATSPSTRNYPATDLGHRASNAAIETHRTQPGDTLAALAREYYGDEKYTRFLAESNPHITDPNRLGVGALIKLPPAPPRVVRSERPLVRSVAATTARPSSGRSYTVRSGDSFYGIARDELGDATRWKELLKLNSALVDGDPKRLRVGQVLVLPQT